MCIVDSVAEPSFKVKRCRGPVGASVSFSAGSVSALVRSKVTAWRLRRVPCSGRGEGFEIEIQLFKAQLLKLVRYSLRGRKMDPVKINLCFLQ